MTSLADTLALIRDAQLGDQEACARLLEENQGLIWGLVRRYAKNRQETEDLYQLGCLGFVKAVQGFDAAYGTRFSTYAVPKIAGEIRRFLRDDGMIKVSRGLKEQAAVIYRARSALRDRLGREPVLSELSEEIGLSPEEIASADLSGEAVASLHAPAREDGGTLEDRIGSTSPEDGILEILSLHTAIEHLPIRERKLIYLRYYKGLTQVKTAQLLGISQVQVSRLEKKAILFLRWQLNGS